MSIEHRLITDLMMQDAVAELQNLIRTRFPDTEFTVGEADDPDGVYMRALVDVDDTDEVTEVFIDRLVALQVEEGLPLYVVTVRMPERIAASLEKEQQDRCRMAFPG